MTRWRNRIGEAGGDELLKETIDAGLHLKGAAGDLINALLSAAGMNFRKLLRFLAAFCLFFASGQYRGPETDQCVLPEITAFSGSTIWGR